METDKCKPLLRSALGSKRGVPMPKLPRQTGAGESTFSAVPCPPSQPQKVLCAGLRRGLRIPGRGALVLAWPPMHFEAMGRGPKLLHLGFRLGEVKFVLPAPKGPMTPCVKIFFLG